jgi:hypothetical protein
MLAAYAAMHVKGQRITPAEIAYWLTDGFQMKPDR